MKTIVLKNEVLDEIDLTKYNKYVNWTEEKNLFQYFNLDSGKEHYKLLAFIANQFDKDTLMADIGTYMGFSAVALAANGHKVVTYDVCDWIPDEGDSIKTHPDITFKIMNCLNDMDELIKAEVIMLDIDPHDGIQEPKIIQALREHNFKGLLLLDDINLNKNMREFWESIPEKKYDVGKYGHWTSTGIVVFDPSKYEIVME